MQVAEAEYLPSLSSLSSQAVRGLDASVRKSQRRSGDGRAGGWAGLGQECSSDDDVLWSLEGC